MLRSLSVEKRRCFINPTREKSWGLFESENKKGYITGSGIIRVRMPGINKTILYKVKLDRIDEEGFVRLN